MNIKLFLISCYVQEYYGDGRHQHETIRHQGSIFDKLFCCCFVFVLTIKQVTMDGTVTVIDKSSGKIIQISKIRFLKIDKRRFRSRRDDDVHDQQRKRQSQ